MDLLLQRALEIANRPRRSQRPVIQPGDLVEWLSCALPRQEGEVLAVHPDGTFEVYHPLAEAVCRLSVSWVTRIMKASEGPIP